MHEYDVFADRLRLKFKCPKCGTDVAYRVMFLPTPNWESESVSGSQENEDDECNCGKCGRQFDITLVATTSYGELSVKDAKTRQEIEDVEVVEEWNNQGPSLFQENENSAFQDWFEEQVKTQYGDIKGVAYLDGHEGPGDIRNLFTECKQLQGYSVLGFEIWYHEEGCDREPLCSVYAVKTSMLKSKGVDNLDYDNDVEAITLENFQMSELNKGIKRLHYGFAIPKHLLKL